MSKSVQQNMKNHSKTFASKEEFFRVNIALNEYQVLHNSLRNDFENLVKLTEKHASIEKDYDTLYRACVRSVLVIIESDVYGLNQIDPYEGYTDNHDFETKLKSTLKQIGKTFNKADITSEYLNTKYQKFKNIKIKRDELTHPKNENHFHTVSLSAIKELKEVYNDYDDMVNRLMNGFFLKIQIHDLLF
jgi:hypothetical protein